MKATPNERDTVLAYIEAPGPRRPCGPPGEKVAVERVGPVVHDIWDVHCRDIRWWAVSEPLNLYSQEDFKSRDVVLTFHYTVCHGGKSCGSCRHEQPVRST